MIHGRLIDYANAVKYIGLIDDSGTIADEILFTENRRFFIL